MRTLTALAWLALAGCPPNASDTAVDPTADRDDDGFVAAEDCNDEDPIIYPGAPEICDGVDNNCDGAIDEDDPANEFAFYEDLDSDGHGSSDSVVFDCTTPPGHVLVGGDCNDSDPEVHPHAIEDDCTDPVDYNCDESTRYEDVDTDLWPACEDCDDSAGSVNPDAVEVPYNGTDDDCDDLTRDDDLDSDGFNNDVDCEDDNPNVHPNATEVVYDQHDNDCDSNTADDDLDSDGSPRAEDCNDRESRETPGGTEEPYDGLDNDCDTSTPDDDIDTDGYLRVFDCDDTDGAVNPDATETTYNGKDDDCDETTRDDDLDSDGVDFEFDCNDQNPNVGPFQTERPYNGLDDDCDGLTVDDDLDSDGFGILTDCDDEDEREAPDHTEIPYNDLDDDCKTQTRDDDVDGDGFLAADDCDDFESREAPDHDEIPYNELDDDCDTDTPDDDVDKDGYLNADDCDDMDSDEAPDHTEIVYNTKDDDCDPATRDDDLDTDSHNLAEDCNDEDGSIYNGAPDEWYDGVDSDCAENDDYDMDSDSHRSRFEIEGGDDCDDDNNAVYECGGTAATAMADCKALKDAYPDLTDGPYWIDGNMAARQVTCEMDFLNGGWTVVTPIQARDWWGGTMSAFDATTTAGIDAQGRPFTRDGSDGHNYTYTLVFPPGFTDISFDGYTIKANGGNGGTSDLGFTQTVWETAYVAGGSGDVSFGSADAAGPVDSFHRHTSPSCQSCVTAWSGSWMPNGFVTVPRTTKFRFGWGEHGGQHEGWYPWWEGKLLLR